MSEEKKGPQIMNNWVITDDLQGMEALGRQIVREKTDIYTKKICETLYRVIDSFMPEGTPTEKEQVFSKVSMTTGPTEIT